MVFAGLASGHTDMPMLYLAYERQAGLLELTRTAARSLLTALSPWDKLTGHPLRYAAAAGALLARAGLTHHRPAYGIGTVVVGNRDVPVTEEVVCATPFGTLLHFKKGSCWLPGCWAGSYDQGGNERAEQGFAATARVVHELEEAEIERQLLLRETAVRAEPGAQQRPEPLDGVDMHLAEAIPVLVAGVFAAPVTDGLVPVAPGGQADVDA